MSKKKHKDVFSARIRDQLKPLILIVLPPESRRSHIFIETLLVHAFRVQPFVDHFATPKANHPRHPNDGEQRKRLLIDLGLPDLLLLTG
ncbi:hypothetical protein INP83_11205 [Mucilaginibacter sp. 21P]|uniref:hypothetical protein n=1 Tax=Mucilaginibacter sp. 21P TaxID=2778902 RepID=UPI001C599E97|nr:hypothetical protein [Mucilaginibacter sp. 21P]QXV63679.1 hypothetical protein INP83_11205 [Mucilaginibacter sp. 21P]